MSPAKGRERAEKACSAQELAFCEAYVTNGRNGTQAAITAGYAASSAHVRAHKLLARPRIQAVIAELTIGAAGKALAQVDKKVAEIAAKEADLAAREEIVAVAETLEQLRERVRLRMINRLIDMGFATAGQVATWTEQDVQFIPSAELTPEALGSVASVEARINEGESQDGKTLFRNVNLKIKQHNPMAAMKQLARLLELNPKAAPTGKAESSGGVVIIVAGGPTGLELGARTPIAVIEAPIASTDHVSPITANSPLRNGIAHCVTPGGAPPAAAPAAAPASLRPWSPGPKKKKGPTPGPSTPTTAAPRAIVSKPLGQS